MHVHVPISEVPWNPWASPASARAAVPVTAPGDALRPPDPRLRGLIATLGLEEGARAYVEELRWPDGVRCPRCDSDRVGWIQTREKHECRSCRYQFRFSSGTIFHDSHLSLSRWLLAVQLILESEAGFPANQLHAIIGGSYKTSWFVGHRIRAAMSGSLVELGMPKALSAAVDQAVLNEQPAQTPTQHDHEDAAADALAHAKNADRRLPQTEPRTPHRLPQRSPLAHRKHRQRTRLPRNHPSPTHHPTTPLAHPHPTNPQHTPGVRDGAIGGASSAAVVDCTSSYAAQALPRNPYRPRPRFRARRDHASPSRRDLRRGSRDLRCADRRSHRLAHPRPPLTQGPTP